MADIDYIPKWLCGETEIHSSSTACDNQEPHLSKLQLTSHSNYPALEWANSNSCILISRGNVCDETAGSAVGRVLTKRESMYLVYLEIKIAKLDCLKVIATQE